jgi:endo-1,4-beta-xylanase
LTKPVKGQNNTPKGSITVDGAVYQLSSYTRVSPGLNDPIIHQHFAVREQQRTSGTVDTGIFFDAWEAAGLKMGDLGYQIVATEGYHSEGASRVTVETPP